MTKSFIELDFPVEQLNPVALSEGNSKKPIYRMHKWWARRLGSIFRAIILSTFRSSDYSSAAVWQDFIGGADLNGKTILDPFMGGGTSIVEALRLGCKVIGIDINPVAWFVTKKEIEPLDLDYLDKEFESLERTAGKRIKAYYRTTCPNGHSADVMYYFWVKTAVCSQCGSTIRLFPNYELSRRDGLFTCLCPNCLQVIDTPVISPETQCPDCTTKFDPRRGVSGRGVFECPQCGKRQKVLDAVDRKGAALEMMLHALEGYCEQCGRFFKRVDDGDKTLWKQVQGEFKRLKDSLLFPGQKIPVEGRSDPRPVNHGYEYFWQMFNERQLLSLSILLEEILKIPEQNYRELMLLAFSDCLNTNNMFCKYEVEWHKISLFFSLHAFHPIERPAENNVWGAKFGRGTFVKCFEKVRNAKEYAQAPYERLFDLRGQRFSKRTGSEKIRGQLVSSFEQMPHVENAAMLCCQTAENLSFLPTGSVDAVITDPPYFDNIQYSELADFFYVWLRLGLKEDYPWFQPPLSSRPAEIIKNEKSGKTTEFFNRGLERVFQECHRVLKDDGLLVFTFHHNKEWAWEGLGALLLAAGFFISATPIVRSEGRGEVHSSEGNIRYDCIFVCRKRPNSLDPVEMTELRKLILDDSVEWTRRTIDSRMPIGEVDIFTIIMGKTIEYYTKLIARDGVETTSINLPHFLSEMAGLTSNLTTNLDVNQVDIPPYSSEKVKQLALFIMESRERFKNGKK